MRYFSPFFSVDAAQLCGLDDMADTFGNESNLLLFRVEKVRWYQSARKGHTEIAKVNNVATVICNGFQQIRCMTYG